MGTLRPLIVAALLAVGLQGLAWSAGEAAPPRGSLIVESNRDARLHGEIWVVNMRTGARRNLSRNPAADRSASVSPDLKSTAFVSDRSGAEEVWVERVAGSTVRRLAGPFGAESSVRSLQWSPSGAELAFMVEPRRQIRIIPRSGRGGRWLGRRASWFGWSPDGKRIAVGAAADTASPFVTIFDRAGRPLARLPGYPGGWSSRGALVVLGSKQTWITDGRGRRAATVAKASEARWSPDGRMLALSGPQGVQLVAADGRLRLRRDGLTLAEAGWAPDSRSLLVRDRSYRLGRLFVGGALSSLADVRGSALWSRGGTMFVLEYVRGGIVVRERGRSGRISFQLPPGGCGGEFSVDGWLDRDRAAVTVGRRGKNPADLWVVSPGGGVTRRFLAGADWLGGPEWSQDGSHLAYDEREVHTHADSCDPGYQSNVAVVRADGTRKRLLGPVDSLTEGARWSPDGRKLVAVRQSFSDEEEFGIVVADADLQAQTRLTTGSGSSPSWSADGNSIVYQRGTSQILRLPAAGGAATVIGQGVEPEASPAAPLVAFVRDRAVWVVGLDGAGERRLAPLRPSPGGYSAVRWSPDGRLIAVSDRDGIVIISATDARSVRVARTGVWSIAWSPDGRQLAFGAPVGRHSGSPRTEVFVVSAAGGAPRRLTHDLANVGGISWRP